MGNMIRNALMGLMVAVAAAGCSKDTATSPSTVNVPFSTTDLRVGTGAEAATGRAATVNYTLWLYNSAGTDNKGTLVQTSVGGSPFTFTVGTGVIPGFSQGVVGMKVGGLRRITIPPSLGYGSQGQPPSIPGNATLIFEIELLAVQ
ncbi:MAG: FKBP-type peptidyl-prolyl cis-trans isomerase [Vicinamibacterales bacterium]